MGRKAKGEGIGSVVDSYRKEQESKLRKKNLAAKKSAREQKKLLRDPDSLRKRIEELGKADDDDSKKLRAELERALVQLNASRKARIDRQEARVVLRPPGTHKRARTNMSSPTQRSNLKLKPGFKPPTAPSRDESTEVAQRRRVVPPRAPSNDDAAISTENQFAPIPPPPPISFRKGVYPPSGVSLIPPPPPLPPGSETAKRVGKNANARKSAQKDLSVSKQQLSQSAKSYVPPPPPPQTKTTNVKNFIPPPPPPVKAVRPPPERLHGSNELRVNGNPSTDEGEASTTTLPPLLSRRIHAAPNPTSSKISCEQLETTKVEHSEKGGPDTNVVQTPKTVVLSQDMKTLVPAAIRTRNIVVKNAANAERTTPIETLMTTKKQDDDDEDYEEFMRQVRKMAPK